MGKKVEQVFIGMSQGIPFEDEVRLAERSAEYRKEKPTAYDDAFPIGNVVDLKAAIQSFGRAPEDKKGTVKAFIKRRARELGHPELIPEGW